MTARAIVLDGAFAAVAERCGCEVVVPQLPAREDRALDLVCQLVDREHARDPRPIVLFGGLLAYRAAARTRRANAVIATALASPPARALPWTRLARWLRSPPEPERLDACPVLLAYPGTEGIAPSRRFFDRLRCPKRLVIVDDSHGGDLEAAVRAFLGAHVH